MKKTCVIRVRVPKDEYDHLAAVAKKRKTSHSSIIRTALGIYYEFVKEAPTQKVEGSPTGEDLLMALR